MFALDLPTEQVFTADENRCIWLFNKLRQLWPDAVRERWLALPDTENPAST